MRSSESPEPVLNWHLMTKIYKITTCGAKYTLNVATMSNHSNRLGIKKSSFGFPILSKHSA